MGFCSWEQGRGQGAEVTGGESGPLLGGLWKGAQAKGSTRTVAQDVFKKDEIRSTFRCAYVLAGQECKGCVTTYFLCTGPRNGEGA